jgi:hypothetical protein
MSQTNDDDGRHIATDGNWRDPDVRRGGPPGGYFFYRPDEILVRAEQVAKVESILGQAEEVPEDSEDRSKQKNAKRRSTQKPFGVVVFHFGGTDVDRQPITVAEALRRLGDEVADYNYVTARSPMRSHAVSYAEPADPRTVKPSLKLSDPPDGALLVGVLDTGRPHYHPRFRKYFSERFEGGTRARGERSDDRLTAAMPSLDETDAIFETVHSRAIEDAEIYDDEDTMVTRFGRLVHPHAGHGLFVSSIIARHAPHVRIVAETTMSYDAIGDLGDILIDLAHASDIAGCKLMNMSLGFPTPENRCPLFLTGAIDELARRNILLVASAGNNGDDRPMWPAAHDNVVAVAATDANGDPTDWSNYGGWVNACARGDDVVSNYVFADWDFPDGTAKRFRGAARWSGTSFAAPFVTARIARETLANGGTPREAWERLEARAEWYKNDSGEQLPYGRVIK